MNEYYFHLDHLTVGYDKKPLIKDICISNDSEKHHPPVKAGRRKCGV